MVMPAHTWKPTLGCLASLPYITALVPNNAPFAPQLLETLLEEYNVGHVVQGIKGRSKLSRDVREREGTVIEAATKAVSKHYRRTSITVHPDRYGDTYQVEFDALKDAYEVLGDAISRRSYIDALMRVLETLGRDTPLLRDAHKSWVRDNRAASQAELSQKAPTKVRHMFLEGGLTSQSPRSAGIIATNLKSRVVHLMLNSLKPHDEFQKCCKGIFVVGADGGGHKEVKLLELRDNRLEQAFKKGEAGSDTLRLEITLPDHGLWTVSWYALLEIDGYSSTTEQSYPKEVDMTHPEVRRLQGQKPGLVGLAREQTGHLRSLINQQLSHQTSNREEQERRYWDLHRVISMARTTQQRLSVTLQLLGESEKSCLVLAPLHQVLSEAITEKTKLDDYISANQKKDSLKSFKQSIATMIEQGEATDWMLTVDKEELVNHGGEPNRLYQLLVEGKKANSLLLDSSALGNAAGRTDLFSKKQCEALVSRRDDVEAQMVIETERMVKEAEQQEAAEKARLEMEKRGRLMARGTHVKLHGLKSKPELNGALGVYMGLGQGDRYVVRLYGAGDKEVSLLSTNFEKFDESLFVAFEEPVVSKTAPHHSPSCWICAKCSFQHEGPLLDAMSQCDMCDTPRGPQPVSFAATASVTPTPSVPESTQRRGVPPPTPVSKGKEVKDGPRECILRTVWIRKADVALFIGHGGGHVREMVVASGAKKIYADKNATTPDGMCPIRITGNSDVVQKAAAMVEKFRQDASAKKTTSFASKQPNGPTALTTNTKANLTPSNGPNLPITVMNGPTPLTTTTIMEKARLTPSTTAYRTAASSMTTAPQSSVGVPTIQNRLLDFLHQHKSCLKCTPDEFHKWLLSEDISSLTELAEAVGEGNDEYVRTDMQDHGLKVSL
jgi:hypothetical protein